MARISGVGNVQPVNFENLASPILVLRFTTSYARNNFGSITLPPGWWEEGVVFEEEGDEIDSTELGWQFQHSGNAQKNEETVALVDQELFLETLASDESLDTMRRMSIEDDPYDSFLPDKYRDFLEQLYRIVRCKSLRYKWTAASFPNLEFQFNELATPVRNPDKYTASLANKIDRILVRLGL